MVFLTPSGMLTHLVVEKVLSHTLQKHVPSECHTPHRSLSEKVHWAKRVQRNPTMSNLTMKALLSVKVSSFNFHGKGRLTWTLKTTGTSTAQRVGKPQAIGLTQLHCCLAGCFHVFPMIGKKTKDKSVQNLVVTLLCD